MVGDASAGVGGDLVSAGHPVRLSVGGGTAVFIDGRWSVDGEAPRVTSVQIGSRVGAVLGERMRPPGGEPGQDYWWTIAEIPASGELASAEITLTGELAGTPVRAVAGVIELQPAPPTPDCGAELERAVEAALGHGSGGEPLVAIAMATHEPDPELFRTQIESIREQTHGRWICLISDDASSDPAFGALKQVLASDPRFVVSRAPENAGFYANFERALTMVPGEAEFVALSDQDDRWYPAKLERLLGGLAGGAKLAYSDMRVVDQGGAEITPTYWAFRENNYRDYASLVIANTVTGAASMFRRELLDDVLPFPPRHRNAFHDHWIAQVAMTLGELAYVDEPLYDYVQHGDASLGFFSANGRGRYSEPLHRRAAAGLRDWRERGWAIAWRPAYFNVYVRTALNARVLLTRCGGRMGSDRRQVLERLSDPRRTAGWAALRTARDFARTTPTLGRERAILGGLVWHRAARAKRRLVRR